MTDIHLFNTHEKLYYFWRENNIEDITLVHIDSHCDMRGLLIDRKNSRAKYAPLIDRLDGGSFLARAVKEGIVSSLKWIHDSQGGRENDIGTVCYESDRLFKIKDIFPTGSWRDFDFKELRLKEWEGPEEGEHLDLDWDFFTAGGVEHVNRRIETFFQKNLSINPEYIYLTYSPRFSPPSLKAFRKFSRQCTEKFDAEIKSDFSDNCVSHSGYYRRLLRRVFIFLKRKLLCNHQH